MSEPNDPVKLVVCNEPENCGTVKGLEAEVKRLTEKFGKFEAGTIREIDESFDDNPCGETGSATDVIIGLEKTLESQLDALKEKAEKWDEFRASFRNHKCSYGIICAEKIDAETQITALKENLEYKIITPTSDLLEHWINEEAKNGWSVISLNHDLYENKVLLGRISTKKDAEARLRAARELLNEEPKLDLYPTDVPDEFLRHINQRWFGRWKIKLEAIVGKPEETLGVSEEAEG